MQGHQVFWGDLHKHLTGPGAPVEAVGDRVAAATETLDFCAVYCYPFEHHTQGSGLLVESTGHRPAFDDWWTEIQHQSRAHHTPHEFVTFPAYEWHGDRRRWGDHHVLYRQEGGPLSAAPSLAALYDEVRDEPAYVIPHHTAYRVGERGRDWSVYDPELSPVMEMYSTHGSSEGVDSPVPMAFNESMGPRTGGGTFRDALAAGHRVGVVASNDGAGVPGAWNRGLAAVWAPELTREAIWEAIAARRTYGVTGDRIELWWELDGTPMGGTVPAGTRTATISVDCPRPLDRVELLGQDRVVDVYAHSPTWERHDTIDGRYRQLIECGWGPTRDYGDFADVVVPWTGTLGIEHGTLRSVMPRLIGTGQSYGLADGELRFALETSRDEPSAALPESVARNATQGFVVEYDANPDTQLTMTVEERESMTFAVADTVGGGQVRAYRAEGMQRIEDAFGVPERELANMDRRYHVSPKVKIHRPFPVRACRADVTVDVSIARGEAVYVRVAQTDGQYAWSSPIWAQ